jgi:hypothetical protein
VAALVVGAATNLVAAGPARADGSDQFRWATPITSLPYAGGGDTTWAHDDVTDPLGACGPIMRQTVWFRYTAPVAQLLHMTFSPNFAGNAAVYRGSSRVDLVPVGCTSPYRNQQEVTFGADGGQTYWIEVGGYLPPYDDTFIPPGGIFSLGLEQVPHADHDEFAHAAPLSGVPATDTRSSYGDTFEPGERVPSCSPGAGAGGTVWYKFTDPVGGQVLASAEGTDHHVAVAVYTGPSLLLLQEVACAEPTVDHNAEAQFAADAGQTYWLQVMRLEPGGGTATMSTTRPSRAPNDLFAAATTIISIPFADSGDIGRAGTETGEPTCSYSNSPTVWYRYTAMADGVLRASSATASDYSGLGAYVGDNLLTLQQVACDPSKYPDGRAIVAFPVHAGTTYWLQVGGFGSYSFDLSIGQAPANDDIANAVVIPHVGPPPVTIADGDNRGASLEAGEVAPPCAPRPSGTVWYRYTAEANTTISVSFWYSGDYPAPDTVAVYQGDDTPSVLLNCANFGTLTFAFGWLVENTIAQVPVVAGHTYWFQVAGENVVAGRFKLGLLQTS